MSFIVIYDKLLEENKVYSELYEVDGNTSEEAWENFKLKNCILTKDFEKDVNKSKSLQKISKSKNCNIYSNQNKEKEFFTIDFINFSIDELKNNKTKREEYIKTVLTTELYECLLNPSIFESKMFAIKQFLYLVDNKKGTFNYDF